MIDLYEPKFRSRRLILREGYSEGVVRRIAKASGWDELAKRPADARRNVALTVIWEVIPGLTVSYYYEPLAEASCLIIRSTRDKAEIREVERLLNQTTVFAGDEDLLSSAATGVSSCERALALLRLGLGGPVNFDQRYFDQLASGADDPDGKIRLAAIRGITYTEWPQFRPLLGQLADHDPVRSVRKLARQVLLIFDALGLADKSASRGCGGR